MNGQVAEDEPAGVRPWETVLRLREPVALALLVLAALGVLLSAGQLFNVHGAAVPPPASPNGQVALTTFAYRSAVIEPQFADFGLTTLPVIAVILVIFAGGMTRRARQVVQTAITVQSVAIVLGIVSWLAATTTHNLRPGIWFVFEAVDLLVLAVSLVFIIGVRLSPALQRPTPQYQADLDDDDLDEEDEDT